MLRFPRLLALKILTPQLPFFDPPSRHTRSQSKLQVSSQLDSAQGGNEPESNAPPPPRLIVPQLLLVDDNDLSMDDEWVVVVRKGKQRQKLKEWTSRQAKNFSHSGDIYEGPSSYKSSILTDIEPFVVQQQQPIVVGLPAANPPQVVPVPQQPAQPQQPIQIPPVQPQPVQPQPIQPQPLVPPVPPQPRPQPPPGPSTRPKVPVGRRPAAAEFEPIDEDDEDPGNTVLSPRLRQSDRYNLRPSPTQSPPPPAPQKDPDWGVNRGPLPKVDRDTLRPSKLDFEPPKPGPSRPVPVRQPNPDPALLRKDLTKGQLADQILFGKTRKTSGPVAKDIVHQYPPVRKKK